MNSEFFWSLIDDSFKEAESSENRSLVLKEKLRSLGKEQLQEFQNHYNSQIKKAYRWDLWGAAYIINGGCSDDGFRYFLDWLISEGSLTFEKALSSPDCLSELPELEDAENESFAYVALEVCEAKGYGGLERDFSIEISMPAGSEWEESELPSLFPRLAEKYGA